jgi:hypothetical protein
VRLFDRTIRLGMAGVAAAVAGGLATVPARAADPNQQELLDRVKALESQVTELKTELKGHESRASSADVAATADAVLRDADRRSQLADPSRLSVSYKDGKLQLRTDDGRFLLHPWLQFQFRNTTTYREDVKQGDTADDLQNGFEVRRLKFGLDGNVFTPDLTYLFQFAVDRHNGSTALEQAYVQYHFAGTPFSLKAGQFKDPLDHEQLVSTRNTVAPDRTLVNDQFANAEAFVQGVDLIYGNGGPFRAQVAFTDGLKSGNTNFQDYPTTGIPADWGAAGRVEYKLFGNWQDYEQLSAYGVDKDLLVVGGGVDYTEAGHTGSLVHVADVQYDNGAGLGLYGAYLGRYTKDNTVNKFTGDTYDWTLRAQASYVINQKWEPFFQYEFIHFDSNTLAAGADNTVHVFRVGTAYYLQGHNAKFQVDLSYLPNGSPVSDDGLGVLQDSGKNELILRGQFQLLL